MSSTGGNIKGSIVGSTGGNIKDSIVGSTRGNIKGSAARDKALMGLGPQTPTNKLVHLEDLVGLQLSGKSVFESFRSEPFPCPAPRYFNPVYSALTDF